MGVTIYSASEINAVRDACQITREALDLVEKQLEAGMTTKDVDHIVESHILSRGGKPAFKGYYGFTGSICASVNEEVVHGVPGSRILQEGDIIGVDTGTKLAGYFSDSCRTFAVGTISSEKQRLLDVTRESLYLAIEQFFEGNRLYTLSHAVQSHVEKHGYSIVRDYVGHGIGRELHEEPQIPNYGKPGTGMRFKKGMIVAIEPMVNMGCAETRVLEDGWTVVTVDNQPSAHFEHTIALTQNGVEILTGG